MTNNCFQVQEASARERKAADEIHQLEQACAELRCQLEQAEQAKLAEQQKLNALEEQFREKVCDIHFTDVYRSGFKI